MFTGVDQVICAVAWELVQPSIKRAANLGVVNKCNGVVIVLDPRKRPVHGTLDECKNAVMFKSALGNGSDYSKYGDIALSKAHVTFKNQMPSSVVQQQFPHLYEVGNTKWGGSTIDAGGLIVAFSGVQAVYDEMIAEWMASAIRALCRWEMTKTDGVMDSDSSFIGS